jgi:hypothetical protein
MTGVGDAYPAHRHSQTLSDLKKSNEVAVYKIGMMPKKKLKKKKKNTKLREKKSFI